LPLRDAVSEADAHVVQQQVGKEIDRLMLQRRDAGALRMERGGVA
jgi:hypothetical protein